MVTGTKRSVGFLGWAASAMVTLAVAAGGSVVVPQLINAEDTPPAVSSASIGAGASIEAPPADVAVAAAPAAEVVVPEVVVPEPETVVTAPPTTRAPRAAAPAAPVVQAPAPTLPAPPPPPPVPVLAPRTVPSAAQVESAIAGISGLVQLPFFFQINAGHVAQVGNQVCTAFDQGQTFAQVKANGLSMVAAYVTVTPAAADYAVRTAVSMYCPAYASRLV